MGDTDIIGIVSAFLTSFFDYRIFLQYIVYIVWVINEISVTLDNFAYFFCLL